MMERRPILRIEMTVKGNTTNKVADKADNYVVSLKSDDGTLLVGMKEAKATLKIKAEDDVAFFNFPVEGKYVIELYSKTRSVVFPPDKTKQNPLATDGKVNDAFATVSSDEEIPEEIEENSG